MAQTHVPIEQANIPRSSATFEFVSHFPDLHMPHTRVADVEMVNPKSATCLVDGELVFVNGKLAEKITTTNLATIKTTSVYLWHGKPGRSDLQASAGGPTIRDTDFEFRTTLVTQDPAETITVGSYLAPGVLGADNGAYETHAGWVTATAGEPYLAVVLDLEGNGWYRLRFERGLTPA